MLFLGVLVQVVDPIKKTEMVGPGFGLVGVVALVLVVFPIKGVRFRDQRETKHARKVQKGGGKGGGLEKRGFESHGLNYTFNRFCPTSIFEKNRSFIGLYPPH